MPDADDVVILTVLLICLVLLPASVALLRRTSLPRNDTARSFRESFDVADNQTTELRIGAHRR